TLLYPRNFANELQHIRMKKLGLLALLLCFTQQLIAQTPTTAIERLRYHVYYLADDSLAGRLTGTTGEMKAANYIVQEFQKIGLQPGGEKGSWLQPFTFTAKQTYGGSLLYFDGEKRNFGSEFAT